MSKHIYAKLCGQQRRSSTGASMLSDQCCTIAVVDIAVIPRHLLCSVDEQI